MHRNLARLLLVILAAVGISACGGEPNPAMSLQFTNRVFVPVSPDRLTETASGPQAPGTWADLRGFFIHTDAEFAPEGPAPAIVVYSNVRYVPAGTPFIPTRVIALFQGALADDAAQGIVLNPGVASTESTVLTREQIKSALPRVMQHKEPLPFEVQVAGQQ